MDGAVIRGILVLLILGGAVTARVFYALIFLVATTVAAVPVLAQTPEDDSTVQVDGWEFSAGAYLFMSSIEGDAVVGPVTADVDVSFGDILERLEGGIMGFGTANYGDWTLIGDLAYLKISDDKALAGAGGALTINLDVELEQTIAAGYIAYQVHERSWSSFPDNDNGFALDLLGGARYNRVETKLGANAALFGLTGSAQRNRTTDWVDPVIGVRATVVPAPNWRIMLWGDYGGFDVGAKSTWQLIGLAGYTLDSGVDLIGGYRVYAFDYREGSGSSRLDLDLTYSGPFAGVGIKF